MSQGDFEEQLRQSVASRAQAIDEQASAAKARIGSAVHDSASSVQGTESAATFGDYDFDAPPRAAVDFGLEEPQPAAAQLDDDPFAAEFASHDTVAADDDGVPVWEDLP